MAIKETKPIMNITVYSDNRIELIVNGKPRHVTKIDFHAEFGEIPTLNTEEFVVYHKNNEGEN